MQSDDGSVCIILNGQSFNLLELLSELESAGYSYRRHPDAEVILLL